MILTGKTEEEFEEYMHEKINYLAKICREKHLTFNHSVFCKEIRITKNNTLIGFCYTSQELCGYNSGIITPILELIKEIESC